MERCINIDWYEVKDPFFRWLPQAVDMELRLLGVLLSFAILSFADASAAHIRAVENCVPQSSLPVGIKDGQVNLSDMTILSSKYPKRVVCPPAPQDNKKPGPVPVPEHVLIDSQIIKLPPNPKNPFV